MGSKGIGLYATRSDYEPVLKVVEEQQRLKYVLNGLLDSPNPTVFYSYSDISDLGVSSKGVAVLDSMYLILPVDMEIVLQEAPQYAGGIRYSMGQNLSPASISFRPGGLFEESYLISGDIGTISSHPTSLALYRLFTREIRKRFTSIRPYWLGPEARRLWDTGLCLTDDVRSSPESCLKHQE